MRVGIVLGGDPPTEAEAVLLRGCGRVVAADSGGVHALSAGVTVHALVGDMDSLPDAARARIEASGARVRLAEPKKDETDGELALAEALLHQPDEIWWFGGAGGRGAMILATAAYLFQARNAGIKTRSFGRHETWVPLNPGDILKIAHTTEGRTFNVLPFGSGAVVSVQGAAFDATRRDLPPTSVLGVSNQTRPGATALVRADQGQVLCIIEGEPFVAPL